MNVIKKFTIQNLKLNKKRTIVTIIGIILSTALICGVAGLVTSTQQTLIDMVIKNVGNYHVRFDNVPANELKYIQENAKVKSSFLTNQIGWAKFEDGKNENKPYFSILEYDEKALQNNGINLIEGRLPQNSNEILISEHIETNGRVKYNIGDTITLDVGTRQLTDGTVLDTSNPYDSYENEGEQLSEEIVNRVSKTYTIVGVMERLDYSVEGFSSPGYTLVTYMDKVTNKANICVTYTHVREYEENNKAINGVANDEEKGKYDIQINKELIRYQGGISGGAMRALLGIAAVVVVIIVFSSIFVIRNSFSISVSEKNRQFGMLSSIGATSKQIKKSVIFEGLIIGIIAIPLGIVLGMIAIYILLQIVNYLLADALQGIKFVYSVPLIPILFAVVVSFITIYFSSLIPAIRASKISPIEAIRGNDDIKIKSKKIKTSKLIKKLFGIGGVIASKNLKRCRRKYRTTVISIVISIVIFISLSSFIEYGNIISNVYYTELDFNMLIDDDLRNVDSYKNIAKFDDIDKWAYYYTGRAKIDLDKYGTEFGKELFNNTYVDVDSEETVSEPQNPQIAVFVYNNEYFKEYIKSLGINEADYNKKAILIDDIISVETDGKKTIKNIYNIHEGDIIDVKLDGANKKDVQIAKKTDQRPMGLQATYSNNGMIIISEAYLSSLDEYKLDRLYVHSTNTNQLENTINDLANSNETYSGIDITNYDKVVEMQNRMVTVISIFLYGFIAVITLIGVTNIFNTITTNMILRSKEFAMLKSVGMTTKEFNKMIRLESILYGLKSLVIGIPIGILGSYFIYKAYAESVDAGYILPVTAIIISIVFVFIIIGLTMKYSLNKINKQNIIDTIRNENV